jgi:hypothetical protein
MPEDWTNFASLVVPELQKRGLTRTEYAAGTLRERLGLPRPANRFVMSKTGSDSKQEAVEQPIPTVS